MTVITGNTYDVKELLKKLGGRWDAHQRVWRVPDERADEAHRLVTLASKGSRPSQWNGYGGPNSRGRKACITGGNCESFGSGRSCGGFDCDGF